MLDKLSETDITIYHAVKQSAGWSDRSSMAIVQVRGADRLDLLHRMTTNEVRGLKSGEGAQTVLLTEKARIIDVLTILAQEESILILFSNGMQERVLGWLDKYTIMDDFKPKDMTSEYGAVQITGPASPQILEELTGASVRTMTMHSSQSVQIMDANALLVRQPTLCEFSFLLLFPVAQKAQVLTGLSSLGDILPQISEEVFEILRIEAGQGRIGAEWTEEHNPLEAGLIGLISFKKGCYIGQEVIARLDSYSKVQHHLMGFISEDDIPIGASFLDGEKATGTITSAAYSPEMERSIALGYIRTQFANPGAELMARSGEKDVPVTIVKLPFTM